MRPCLHASESYPSTSLWGMRSALSAIELYLTNQSPNRAVQPGRFVQSNPGRLLVDRLFGGRLAQHQAPTKT